MGEHIALERLATSFRELSDLYPQGPATLPPGERKTFVERVFKHAGYDYTLTLQALATSPPHAWDRWRRDMIELVTFPHHGNGQREQLATVYSTQQLEYIMRLEPSVTRPAPDTPPSNP
ncbi:MAG: hypothetical protein AABY83_09425 [Pseudomonadota bacterium]